MILRQLFLQHIGQTSDFPLRLEIEKAEGIYMFDKYGKSYIDLISGVSVILWFMVNTYKHHKLIMQNY